MNNSRVKIKTKPQNHRKLNNTFKNIYTISKKVGMNCQIRAGNWQYEWIWQNNCL